MNEYPIHPKKDDGIAWGAREGPSALRKLKIILLCTKHYW
jgi:hypothetical protein